VALLEWSLPALEQTFAHFVRWRDRARLTIIDEELRPYLRVRHLQNPSAYAVPRD
jgi:hypothetical protein